MKLRALSAEYNAASNVQTLRTQSESLRVAQAQRKEAQDKLEVIVHAEQADAAVEAISGAAKTGQIGDGKLFVSPIEHSLRIRTGETDSDAL